MERNQLYGNQIKFFIASTKDKIKDANKDKEKKDLTEIDYKFKISGYNGIIDALGNLKSDNIETEIINSMEIYNKALSGLKINYLDNYDKNFTIFYLIQSALSYLMILLTIIDNPQSACPINKEYLLNKSISILEEKIEKAILIKDKKTISELKIEIGILKKLYEENLKLL